MNTAETFRIVRAGAEHLDIAAPLFDAYLQFYKLPSDEDAARRFLNARLRRGESAVFLAVEERSAKHAGLGFLQMYPTFSSLTLKPFWILNDLYVVPEARKRGVAKALMESARQLASESGASGLALETAKDNLPAQKLYEQLGWKREEVFYRYELMLD